MNKTRPHRVYFRVNQEELDWINAQVKASGDTRQDYLLHKVVTLDKVGGDTNQEKETPKEKICPECGGTLILKNGRRGKFLGCSNFPNCRHTEDWTGD